MKPLHLSRHLACEGRCGSRIVWPLRWIANPLVFHRGFESPLPRHQRSRFKFRDTYRYSMSATESIVMVIFGIALCLVVIRHLMLKPSNNRSWVNDNDRLANAEFDGDYVTIKNIRDFNWRSTRDYDEKWIEKKINLTEVSKLWFVLEYFDPRKRQMAHTILGFEFTDGSRICCSIEVRREKGEKYHPIRGFFRQYELIYVWATERDAIGVRARCRKKSVTHLFEAVVLGPETKERC